MILSIQNMPTYCVYDKCSKRCSFNLPSENQGLYCFDHKFENMVDVKNKRCIHENCTKRPTFNLPTETQGLYCSEHKKENMVNVKHKWCIHENCTKIPVFNTRFQVRIIQLFYDDMYEEYLSKKEEDITYLICV